jgi:hypothetical protein
VDTYAYSCVCVCVCVCVYTSTCVCVCLSVTWMLWSLQTVVSYSPVYFRGLELLCGVCYFSGHSPGLTVRITQTADFSPAAIPLPCHPCYCKVE